MVLTTTFTMPHNHQRVHEECVSNINTKDFQFVLTRALGLMTVAARGEELLYKTHSERRKVEYFPNLNCLAIIENYCLVLFCSVAAVRAGMGSWRCIHQVTATLNLIDHKNEASQIEKLYEGKPLGQYSSNFSENKVCFIHTVYLQKSAILRARGHGSI